MGGSTRHIHPLEGGDEKRRRGVLLEMREKEAWRH